MAEEFDTSWFNLKNYEPFKTMSIQEWASQLEVRAYCFNAEQEEFGWAMSAMANALKKGVLETDETIDELCNDVIGRALKSHLFSTATVGSLTNHQVWDMTNDRIPLTNAVRAFQSMREEWLKPWEDGENKGNVLEAAYAPYDFHFKQYLGMDYNPSMAHVTVDLHATDEQIEIDFSHWLLHYRKDTGHCVPKKKIHEKLFTQEVFDAWIDDGLIPYLDLVLIAEIEGKSITQEELGELIFPGEADRTWDISHKINLML